MVSTGTSAWVESAASERTVTVPLEQGNTAQVVVTPPTSWEEAIRRTVAADIVLVIFTPGDDTAVPGKLYEALALGEPGVTFVGRLATYRYYNMDQVVGQALATFRRLDAARTAGAAQTALIATAG